jgi:hypothetical protein
LVGSHPEQPWDSGRHFFAAAAEAKRRILDENARRKRRLKHGGEFQQVELNDDLLATEGPTEDVVAVGEALEQLTGVDHQAAELVKLPWILGRPCGTR